MQTNSDVIRGVCFLHHLLDNFEPGCASSDTKHAAKSMCLATTSTTLRDLPSVDHGNSDAVDAQRPDMILTFTSIAHVLVALPGQCQVYHNREPEPGPHLAAAWKINNVALQPYVGEFRQAQELTHPL